MSIFFQMVNEAQKVEESNQGHTVEFATTTTKTLNSGLLVPIPFFPPTP